jgi:cell division protein FtsB
MIIKRNRGPQWLGWQRRMVTGAHYVGIAVCLLLLTVLIFGDMGLPRYFSMREHAIDGLQHDPAKIEQLAREQLGYVRKGETVYQLIPPPSQERPRP